MKDIGRTNDGKILVEMGEEELSMFSMLSRAIEGSSYPIIPEFQRFVSMDFTNVFGAIRAFAEAKFKVNEIRKFADELDESLNKV